MRGVIPIYQSTAPPQISLLGNANDLAPRILSSPLRNDWRLYHGARAIIFRVVNTRESLGTSSSELRSTMLLRLSFNPAHHKLLLDKQVGLLASSPWEMGRMCSYTCLHPLLRLSCYQKQDLSRPQLHRVDMRSCPHR